MDCKRNLVLKVCGTGSYVLYTDCIGVFTGVCGLRYRSLHPIAEDPATFVCLARPGGIAMLSLVSIAVAASLPATLPLLVIPLALFALYLWRSRKYRE